MIVSIILLIILLYISWGKSKSKSKPTVKSKSTVPKPTVKPARALQNVMKRMGYNNTPYKVINS